jgi:hypothetical protein
MMVAKPLRARVRTGEITRSVRIWQRPRVKVGGRYPIDGGHVVVEDLREIGPDELTDSLARHTGFNDLPDLLATAQHGHGDRIFLVDFRFEAA